LDIAFTNLANFANNYYAKYSDMFSNSKNNRKNNKWVKCKISNGIKPLSHGNLTLEQKNNTKKHEQLTLSHDVRGNSISTHKTKNNTSIDIRHAFCMHNTLIIINLNTKKLKI
jgi:hypothetical protein